MTTIVFDGRYVVADGRSTFGMTISGKNIQKIWEFEATLKGVKTKILFGGAGSFETVNIVKHWLESGFDPYDCFNPDQMRPEVDGDRFSGFFVTKDGGVYEMESALVPMAMEAPVVLGSGGEFALAFLTAGLHPIEAMYKVMELDSGTGGQIRVFDTVAWQWVDPESLRQINP